MTKDVIATHGSAYLVVTLARKKIVGVGKTAGLYGAQGSGRGSKEGVKRRGATQEALVLVV